MSAPDSNRRRHTREACDLRARIVFGDGAMVFCRAIDRSAGGLCLTVPPRLTLQTGETLLLEGPAPLAGGRTCRVVAVSPRGCHVAFV